MQARDLKVGDRVSVVLPYEGGRGVARIKSLIHMGAVVEFEPGYRHIYQWDNKTVFLRSVVRKEED